MESINPEHNPDCSRTLQQPIVSDILSMMHALDLDEMADRFCHRLTFHCRISPDFLDILQDLFLAEFPPCPEDLAGWKDYDPDAPNDPGDIDLEDFESDALPF